VSYPRSKQREPSESAPVPLPGAVIGAAVLAFILAALQVLGAFNEFVLATQIPNLSPSERGDLLMTSPTAYYLFSLVELVIAVFLVWGGVAALRGTSKTILFSTAVVLGILAAVGLAAFGVFSMAGLLLVLAGIILRLLRASSSRKFFESRE
jgi:hypothetical protein